MRKRDLGILIVSVVSVFIPLQHEGSFSFKEAWFYPLDESSSPVRHETQTLPPPVVVDLNGDGRSEVILVTHMATLQKKLEDVTGGEAGMKERHFSYYAFNGANGDPRWKHDSKDFHRDGPALGEKLLPQHNYKLDANALSGRHFGEAENFGVLIEEGAGTGGMQGLSRIHFGGNAS